MVTNMIAPIDWIPMRWPSGPLDTLWHDPAALDLLRDTPVNCIIVTWASGLGQDAERQRALAPLVARALRDGLTVIGSVTGSADRGAAATRAKASGLSAILTDDGIPMTDFPVYAVRPRSKPGWDSQTAILPMADNVWPGIRLGGKRGDGATAAASGLPWLDSNGWFLRLARTRMKPEKSLWLLMDPPGEEKVITPESYMLAVTDTEAHGGHWVMSLDGSLRAALASRNPSALSDWRRITETLRFFARHPEWKTFRATGMLSVISDFAGANEFLGHELLNLLARHQMPARAIYTSDAATTRFTGLSCVIHIDEPPPSGELRRKLLDFAGAGGLLIVSRSWRVEGRPMKHDSDSPVELRALGKGRIAFCKEASPDPYRVTIDIRAILGHAGDELRLYNFGAAMMTSYSISPDGNRALLHLLNYSNRASAHPITLWFRESYRSARFWTPASASSAPLKTAPGPRGVEVYVPPVPAYGAIELEK